MIELARAAGVGAAVHRSRSDLRATCWWTTPRISRSSCGGSRSRLRCCRRRRRSSAWRTRWCRMRRGSTCATSRCATAPHLDTKRPLARRGHRGRAAGLRARGAGFRRATPGSSIARSATTRRTSRSRSPRHRCASAPTGSSRSTWPAARPAALRAPRRRVRHRAGGGLGSRCTPAKRPGPSRSPRRSIAVMPIGSGTGPGSTRTRAREYVRDRRIAVEINITSNLQTHAVERPRRTRCAATSIAGST